MKHCLRCLYRTLDWIPSHLGRNRGDSTPYGCSTTVCAMQMNGATKDDAHCGHDGCKKLSDEDVALLSKLEPHQRCNWKGDVAYICDTTVEELRDEVRSAIVRLEAERLAESSSATPDVETTTDQSVETKHNLDVEHLRVQIDISNALHGLLEIQHRRQAHREAAAGNKSALAQIDADNFPTIPPRVGPSTLPRSIGITHLVDSEDDEEPDNSEAAKAAGKKRAAPDGSGQTAAGNKKPKAK